LKSFFDLSSSQRKTVYLIVLAAVGLWVVDAIDDLSHGSSWVHLGVELALVLLAAYGSTTFAVRYFASKRENTKIQGDLEKVRSDLESYRKDTEHLAKGLSAKIDQQLERWQMTAAEKEIALLMLKGFSVKVIADLRGTSEKTVTQQISSIYSKSGLHSRSEFSAFFLEDLLVPQI